MEDYKLKAADLVVDSLKLIQGLSTLLFGGLFSYWTAHDSPLSTAAMWGLGLLLAAAICSVVAILNVINKVQRDDGDVIKRWDVRGFHVAAAATLLVGLLVAVFSFHPRTGTRGDSGLPNTTIDGTGVRVGTEETGTVTVTKLPTGAIERIVVERKK